MLRYYNSKLFGIISILLVILVSVTACTQVNAPTAEQSILLNDLTTKDGFVYKDYEWFLSESDFFSKSKMDEKKSILSQQATQDIISDKKTQTYDKPGITIFPVFFFDRGKLVRVQLEARFTDNQSFLSCAEEMKSVLDKNLEKPHIENTDFLTETPPVTGVGLGGVKWDRKDGSSMQISTFNHTETNIDNPYYVISIGISAPVSNDNRGLPPN